MSEPERILTFYHSTSKAAARLILTEGFRDAVGRYGTDQEFSGVWLSGRPLDVNDHGGASDEAVLVITIPETESLFDSFEWTEEGKGYREWLVPAAIINESCTVTALIEESVSGAADRIAERYQDSDPSRLIDFLADERQTAALDEESARMGKLVAELMHAIRAAEKSGMTRYQIANKAGISHANISRLMSGERVTITVDTLEKVLEALGIQITLRKKTNRK